MGSKYETSYRYTDIKSGVEIMNKTIIISLITSAMLCGGADVFAKTVEIKEASAENAGQTYTLRIYDIGSKAGSDNAEDLIYADEAKSDENKNITFTFDIDMTSGYYPYIIKSKSGLWEKTGKLSYINDNELEEAKKELAAAVASENAGAAVKAVFAKYTGIFQLDDGFEIAPELEKLNTVKAYNNIAAKIKDNFDVENIKKIYKTEMMLAAAEYADAELIAKIDSDYLYSQTEINSAVKKIYDAFSEADKKAAAQMEKSAYKTLEEYALAHMKVVSIRSMNNSSSWMELKKISEDTYSVIGISRPSTNVNDVYNKLYSKKPFSDTDDYDKKLAAVSKSSDLSGSGGGTKSTGGGGGGGKGFYNPTTSGSDNTDLPKADRFSDIKSVSWAEEAILSLAEKGVISGRADGIFAPNDNMTREEFVKLVVLAFELSAEGESNFADVEYDKWYAPFINAAVSNGVVKGLSDREFGLGLSGEMDWIYLINIYDDDDDDQMSFKLVTRAGNVASVKCADRVTIDGVSYKRSEKSAVKSCFMQNNIVLSQALRLSVNDDGDINKIDTVYMNTEKENQSEAVRVLGTSDVAQMAFGAEIV